MFRSLLENLQRITPGTVEADRVVEVHADDYVCNNVVCREDCLVLYRTLDNDTQKLDIVMQIDINHTYNKAFSLYRTSDETHGLQLFYQFRDRLPLLVQCVPDIGTSKVLLQNVAKLIQDKQTWTVAHIASHFGYTDCFKNKVVQSQVNISCEETGQTPLHIAVRALQTTSTSALVELGARTDANDVNGDTPLHYAATTNKDIIHVLTKNSPLATLNAYNGRGCTPFHLACMADKTDCVMELLKVGVDVNLSCAMHFPPVESSMDIDSPPRSMKEVLDTYSNRFSNSDIKYGGTPLHWAKTPELTEVLIDHGCFINARNFQGDTALHVMVRRSRLTCAVMLLSHRAETDIRNSEGDTPLHLAVKAGDLSLTQMFISFGADVDITNEIGETPRHLAASMRQGEVLYALHAIGARRCPASAPSCGDGCAPSGHFSGIPPDKCAFHKVAENLLEELLQPISVALKSELLPGQGERVLCLDGGGIRGLVLIQMLDEIERLLGCPIGQAFDLVAGTSTGGILALVLATGKSMRDSRCLYFRLKDKVFVGSRPYDGTLLETFLKNELGESTVMGDIKRPRVMVTATTADRKPADLHIFRNYDSPLQVLNQVEKDSITNEVLPNNREKLIWQVGRCTGAAPTYFRPLGPYIDGGLISNNPSLDAITEQHQLNSAFQSMGMDDRIRPIKVLVSLGTGRPPLTPVNTIDVHWPDTVWGACRMALGVTNLGELLVDQATQTDGRVTARVSAVCGLLKIPYMRLNPQLTENVALDETDTKVLVKMLWETTAYMRLMREQLLQLTELLRR